jgi:hypothetical protein
MERPAPIRKRGLCCESEDKQYSATSERSRSTKRIKFVGLDVHAETVAEAVAEQDGELRSLGVLPNRGEAVRKLVRKLGAVEELRFCYEAGPTGYVLYWQLSKLGAQCVMVGSDFSGGEGRDRVKTDRRDALKLARNHRAGELTAVCYALRYTNFYGAMLCGKLELTKRSYICGKYTVL